MDTCRPQSKSVANIMSFATNQQWTSSTFKDRMQDAKNCGEARSLTKGGKELWDTGCVPGRYRSQVSILGKFGEGTLEFAHPPLVLLLVCRLLTFAIHLCLARSLTLTRDLHSLVCLVDRDLQQKVAALVHCSTSLECRLHSSVRWAWIFSKTGPIKISRLMVTKLQALVTGNSIIFPIIDFTTSDLRYVWQYKLWGWPIKCVRFPQCLRWGRSNKGSWSCDEVCKQLYGLESDAPHPHTGEIKANKVLKSYLEIRFLQAWDISNQEILICLLL